MQESGTLGAPYNLDWPGSLQGAHQLGVGIGVQVERTYPFLWGTSQGLALPHTLSLAYLRGSEVERPWEEPTAKVSPLCREAPGGWQGGYSSWLCHPPSLDVPHATSTGSEAGSWSLGC